MSTRVHHLMGANLSLPLPLSHPHYLLMPHLITRVRQVQVPIRPLGRQHHHANDTARAAIPPDSLLQRILDEVNCLLLLHTLLPVRVAVAIDVGGARTSDRVGLFVQGTAQGNAVYLATVALVPACDDKSGTIVATVSANEP